jgi:UbiD family decarboxylase
MATWCALKVDTDKLRAMKTNSKDFCRKLADIAYDQKSTMLINRLLIFGDDVDIYDFKNIIWAYTTRCRPGMDEYVFEDVRSFFLTPYMAYGNGDKTGGKTVADCLMKYEYEQPRDFKEVSFEASYPEDLKKKIVTGWRDMGFTSS